MDLACVLSVRLIPVAGKLLGLNTGSPRTDTNSPNVKEELRSQTHVTEQFLKKREKRKILNNRK